MLSLNRPFSTFSGTHPASQVLCGIRLHFPTDLPVTSSGTLLATSARCARPALANEITKNDAIRSVHPWILNHFDPIWPEHVWLCLL
jgi:hypothetical protein